ncbi:hypothetical protein E2C01_102592 [Portunus trituberculatus]|uniref:Uncharacterized protein n=1 Tax=Portunus trituberculatus TaxID=210409 RepID=A0A5B7KIQ2_PORTR|nr:hypothetical protein [Portunus trituberculatus]
MNVSYNTKSTIHPSNIPPPSQQHNRRHCPLALPASQPASQPLCEARRSYVAVQGVTERGGAGARRGGTGRDGRNKGLHSATLPKLQLTVVTY